MAQTIVQEKEKEIQDIRPAEHNHEVDPDREHQKQEAEEQTQKEKKPLLKTQEKEEKSSLHLLDVKV
jgi:hypothetical protein